MKIRRPASGPITWDALHADGRHAHVTAQGWYAARKAAAVEFGCAVEDLDVRECRPETCPAGGRVA